MDETLTCKQIPAIRTNFEGGEGSLLKFFCSGCRTWITHGAGFYFGDGNGHRVSNCRCYKPDGYILRETVDYDFLLEDAPINGLNHEWLSRNGHNIGISHCNQCQFLFSYSVEYELSQTTTIEAWNDVFLICSSCSVKHPNDGIDLLIAKKHLPEVVGSEGIDCDLIEFDFSTSFFRNTSHRVMLAWALAQNINFTKRLLTCQSLGLRNDFLLSCYRGFKTEELSAETWADVLLSVPYEDIGSMLLLLKQDEKDTELGLGRERRWYRGAAVFFISNLISEFKRIKNCQCRWVDSEVSWEASVVICEECLASPRPSLASYPLLRVYCPWD